MDMPATFFRYGLPAREYIEQVRLLGDTGSPGGLRNNSQTLARAQKADRLMQAGRKVESHFRRLANHSGARNSPLGQRLDYNTLRRAGDSMFARGEARMAQTLRTGIYGSAGMQMPARFPGVPNVTARAASTLTERLGAAAPRLGAAGLGMRLSSTLSSAAAAVGSTAGAVIAVVAAVAAVAAIAYGIYTLVQVARTPAAEASPVIPEESAPTEPERVVPPAEILSFGGDYRQPPRSEFRDPGLMAEIMRHLPKHFSFS